MTAMHVTSLAGYAGKVPSSAKLLVQNQLNHELVQRSCAKPHQAQYPCIVYLVDTARLTWLPAHCNDFW